MVIIKPNIHPPRFQIESIANLNISYSADNGCPTICKEWQMVYIIKGQLSITYNEHIYDMHEGDIALLSPGDFYYIRTIGSEYLQIEFSLNNLLASEVSGKLVNASIHEQLLAQEICRLENKFNNTTEYNKICCLLELMLLYCTNNEPLESVNKNRDTVLFHKAVAILKKEVQSQISVADLANTLGISLSHLKRIFAQYVKLGVHEYYNYLKINIAKQKLSEGESVTSTAEYLGFANQSYFSTAFKRITGISPKEFSLEKVGSTPNKTRSARKQIKSRQMPDYLL